MAVSSNDDTTISTNKATADSIKNITHKDHIDLNDILSDLKAISVVTSNLAVALSVYLDQRGELDPKRFKLVAD